MFIVAAIALDFKVKRIPAIEFPATLQPVERGNSRVEKGLRALSLTLRRCYG